LYLTGLASIVEFSPTGVITFNAQGIMSSINDSAMRMLNFTKEELVGISNQSLEQKLNKKCLHKMRHHGDIDTSLLITMDETPLIIKRVIRTNPSSSPASEIHYFHDITQETNVSEMKTELLFATAHELRNSLSSIHGYAELLLKRTTSKDAQSKEFLKIILKQSTRLNNMINDTLDLGRSDQENTLELATEKVEVNSFVEGIAEEFFANTKADIHLYKQSIYIDADKEKLSQAIINILSNAKKYSNEGSPIMIDITLDTDSNMLGIKVADKGIGMTPVQQSQLFTRFYRANPEGNIVGTGLGLCFVKEILELHCGGVEVQSQKGEGTQVTLWIPTVDNSKLH
jgi:signal transduction histidine kinase